MGSRQRADRIAQAGIVRHFCQLRRQTTKIVDGLVRTRQIGNGLVGPRQGNRPPLALGPNSFDDAGKQRADPVEMPARFVKAVVVGGALITTARPPAEHLECIGEERNPVAFGEQRLVGDTLVAQIAGKILVDRVLIDRTQVEWQAQR